MAAGEFALPLLLAPGAWARQPLLDDFEKLRVPVSFIYGATDWMDWRAGQEACGIVRAQGVPASLARIAEAGHNVMIDQPALFCEQVIAAIREEGGDRSAAQQHT